MDKQRISQRTDRAKTEPTPACRESQIRHRPKDRLVIVRRAFVEICGGNYVAAALLNECMFISDSRLSAGEPEWFQRKASYWVAALQGLASERTIRDAFKTIKSLRLMDFKQANGDQAGACYKLRVDQLQAAIDGLEPDRPEPDDDPGKNDQTQEPQGDDPGKNDPPPPAELPTTPAETTGHPGKNDRGSHLLYTRAQEPSSDPLSEKKQNQQQADLGVTDSDRETHTPAADQDDFSFRRTLQSLKAQGFPDAERGQKWESDAKAAGFADDELAEVIADEGFPIHDCRTPRGAILKAKDILQRCKQGEAFCDKPKETERDKPVPMDWAAEKRRLRAQRRRANRDNPGMFPAAQHLWVGNSCGRCQDEFRVEIDTENGELLTRCPSCDAEQLPAELLEKHKILCALRERGVPWESLAAAYKAKVSKLSIDGPHRMAWESVDQWHARLRKLGWPIPGRRGQAEAAA